MRKPAYLVLLVGLSVSLVGACPVGTSGPGPSANDLVCAEPADGAAWRDEVLRLINVERTNRGLVGLTRQAVLDEQANDYACEMIEYDFMAHVNPVTGETLRDRFAASGYETGTMGENLAAGQRSPAQVVSEWMNSTGHRANILETRFVDVGVGVRTGGSMDVYWVLEFGGGPTARVVPTDACTVPSDASVSCAELLRLINVEREAQGLADVLAEPKLTAAAEQYACDMIMHNFFGHVDPATGSTMQSRAEAVGYEAAALGENLAGGPRTPAEVMDEWMQHATYRTALLDARFTQAGAAMRTGGEKGMYWVLELGLPQP